MKRLCKHEWRIRRHFPRDLICDKCQSVIRASTRRLNIEELKGQGISDS